jgi:hypothetical protein
MGITVIDTESNDDADGAICIGTIGFDAYLATVAQRSLGWQPELADAALRPARVPVVVGL